MKTVFAPATPLSPSAVAIVRMTGDDALPIAATLFSSRECDIKAIEPRKMVLGTLSAHGIHDKAFCIYYKAPKSYTGEDMIEFQLHGGVSVINGLLEALALQGAVPAGPGEFTRRAFLNGKLTLAEAEGVADMINATSRAEANQAYRMMTGELSSGIYDCCALILTAEANLEVSLDYPEEIAEDYRLPTLQIIKEAKEKLDALVSGAAKRKYLTEGVTVAIAGLTNVGKSSLMNALLKDERAIVTDIAGTTRDTLRETLEIDGFKLNVVDTAGIRKTSDAVEAIGVDRARKAAEGADLILFLLDLSIPESAEEKELLASFQGKNLLTVGNKSDNIRYPRPCDIEISAKYRSNTDALIKAIASRLELEKTASSSVITRERHLAAVKEAAISLQSAVQHYDLVTPDCTAVDLKAAYRALCSITGDDVEESVVDKIFSEFCVGK